MSELDKNIIWAVKNGDVEEVKNLVAQVKHLTVVIKKNVDGGITQGADVNTIEVAGRKLIHFAADCGQLEVLEYLLHVGAEINALDVYGFTALLSAIYEGHLDCVKLLVSKGADKSAKSPEGMNYVEIADSHDMKELLK